MRIALTLTVLVFIILFSPFYSYASGFGIFLPATFGEANFDYYSYDESHFGIGFLFDTNVSKNRVFNYRLNAGFEFFEHSDLKSEDDFWAGYYAENKSANYSMMRIALDNTFGFAVLRTSAVRLWLGPQARLGWILGDRSGMTIGAGITLLGINFNIGPVFSMGFEGGYRFAGNIYFESIDSGALLDGSSDQESSFNDEFYMKLSLIYKINDLYEK